MKTVARSTRLPKSDTIFKRGFLIYDERNSPIRGEASGLVRHLPPLAALQAFERAATQLSFRRAARDLALSPSAVSHQIRNLEEHFGVRLFARASRSVRLTLQGERYLQSVRQALFLLEAASRDLRTQARGGPSHLRISALPFFTSAILIPSLADFERRCANVRLTIEGTHQYADFDAGCVDVAIRYGREHAVGLKLERLINVTGLPVCAPQLIARGLKVPANLADAVLIHVSQQPRAWTAWLTEMGLPALVARRELWLDSVPAALEAAERGLGVALAMHPLIKAWRGFGRSLVAPFPRRSERAETIYLVCRPEQAQDKLIVAFRSWLFDAIANVTGARRNVRTLPVSRPARKPAN
jgi:LysR family glycine cleavage system transcriptional activator